MKREEYIELLRRYEAFLSEIPLDKYKDELRPLEAPMSCKIFSVD
jgi:hypothetical protein